MSNRGLHTPVTGVALALNGHLRNLTRMAKVRQLPGRSGWVMDYKDAAGKRRLRKGGETKSEAELNLALKSSKIAVVRAGLVSRQMYELAEHGAKPIGDHLKLYIASLKGRRKTPRYIAGTEKMILAWIDACDVLALDDVTAVRMETWLAEKLEGDDAVGYRTRNAYFKAARGFLTWCVKHGRLAANPLLSIHILNEKEDRRAPSRALTVDQFNTVVESCPCPKRKLWYLLAGRMGLRWGEIARLRWSQFDLDGAYLLLDAGATKNRRDDALPVPADVMDQLKKMPAADGLIFASAPTMRTWRHDLVRAGIVVLIDPEAPQRTRFDEANLTGYADDSGAQYDRKSLRKTFGTHLARAGVDLRIAQRLMRHSDPKLTANVYTDPVLLDMRSAVDRATPAQHETQQNRMGAA